MTFEASSAPATVPGSDRVRLAVVALGAARGVEGVVGGEAGPNGLLVTSGPGGEALAGVRVIAEPGGRYSVDLGLNAALVPLHPLGATVRDRLTRAVEAAGLGDQLGTVSVAFLALEGAAR